MKNCFSVYFNNTEIVLSKNDVHFKNGYAVINPFYSVENEEGSYEFVPLIGVIDENYQVVEALYTRNVMPKVDIFKNNNFVYMIRYESNGEIITEIYQGEFDKTNLKRYFSLEAYDYEVINDDVVKLHADVEGYAMYALYNVVDKKISDYYNYISNFKYSEEYQEEVAEACYLVVDEEGEALDIIRVIIDTSGNIKSSFKDIKFGLETNDLEEMKMLIKTNLGVHTR